MLTSKRLARLGSGVFDRNDQRKRSYKLGATQQQQPLIDLSLGCTDLLPPPAAVQAIGDHLQDPGSAAYCLHAATASFREAAAAWCEKLSLIHI